jgi:hypothetical protein
MNPLQLAIAISAVDQASRVLSSVQEKLEGFERVAQSMRAVGEGMTVAGGLMRAAGDALGFSEAARSAMDFQDEIARVNTVLPPTSEGLHELGEIQRFAIEQSKHHAYAAKDVAESVYMGLSSFLSAKEAIAATAVAEQVAIGTHGQLADVMRTLGTLYTSALQYATAAVTRQGTLDLQASLSNLAAWIRAHPGFGASEALTKALGMRGAQAQLVIQQLSTLDTAQQALAHSGGAAVRAQQIAEATASERYQILRNNLEAVVEELADRVLPTVTRWLDTLSHGLDRLGAFFERHQILAEVLAKVAIALGVLAPAADGALLILGPILITLSYLMSLLGAVPSALTLMAGGFASMASRALAGWAALAQGEKVMASLNAVLGPWGLVLAAAAALGFAAYEIWRHWDAIMPKLVAVWDMLKPEHLFGRLIPGFVTAGVHLVEAIAKGIWSVATLPVQALKAVVGKLRNLLPFSPAREVPLRELDRVRIVQTIAETIRLEPLVSAMSTALQPMVSMMPTTVTPGAVAGHQGVMAAGGGVTVHYSPRITVNGGGAEAADDWAAAARRHADELVRIIEAKLARRQRLRFAHS